MKTPVHVTSSLRASSGSVYKPPPPWIQQRYSGHDRPSGRGNDEGHGHGGYGGYGGHGGHGSTGREGSSTATSLSGEATEDFYRSNANVARRGVPRQAHTKTYNGRMAYAYSRSTQVLTTTANVLQEASERLGLNAKYLRSSCSVAVIFAIVLMPFIVALLVSDDNSRRMPSIEKDVRSALMDIVMANGTEDRWAEHIVVTQEGGSASVDIPATFHSRLNSELAPLMRQHASEIWGKSETPELKCSPPEKQIVSFSMAKSSRLPAECMLEESNQTESIRDIRDLRVTFPAKSSRHMMRVQIAEDRRGPENAEDSLRRYSSWGRFRGRILVDLSDTSKLAMQRYCGESDADVDIEPLAASDVLLITVLELKRLHGLWTVGSSSHSNHPKDPKFDSIFRAVIAPLDLYPAHSSPIHALREGLRSKMWQAENHTPASGEEHIRNGVRIESEPLTAATDSPLVRSETETKSPISLSETSTNAIQTSAESSLNESDAEGEDGEGDNDDTDESLAQQMNEDLPLSRQSDVRQQQRDDQNINKSDPEPGLEKVAGGYSSLSNVAVVEQVGERQGTSYSDKAAGKQELSSDTQAASSQTPSDVDARNENVAPRFAPTDAVYRGRGQQEIPAKRSMPSKFVGAENQVAAEDVESDMRSHSLVSPDQVTSDAPVRSQGYPQRPASSDSQNPALEKQAQVPSVVSARSQREPQQPALPDPQQPASGQYEVPAQMSSAVSARNQRAPQRPASPHLHQPARGQHEATIATHPETQVDSSAGSSVAQTATLSHDLALLSESKTTGTGSRAPSADPVPNRMAQTAGRQSFQPSLQAPAKAPPNDVSGTLQQQYEAMRQRRRRRQSNIHSRAAA